MNPRWTKAEDDVAVLALPSADVAAQVGRSIFAVGSRRRVLRRRGVPVPDMRGHPSPAPSPAFLAAGAQHAAAHNAARARDAGHRHAEAAAAVLREYPPPNPVTRRVLELRAEHPETPTRVLADMAGLTKNSFNSRLRRALRRKRPNLPLVYPAATVDQDTWVIVQLFYGYTMAQIADAAGISQYKVSSILWNAVEEAGCNG